MQLTTLDWTIVLVSIAVSFAPAIWLARRAGASTAEFFASGRAAPWWLIGVSMVATTFSTDTPNLVTNLVREGGVAANWVWWAFLLTGMMTVFFYARLWRRLGVLTDLEFYELRYSGAAASWVRGFRAVYLGLLFNVMIMATVTLAAAKIANVVLGWSMARTLVVCSVINVLFAAISGLWGVLVTDLFQFAIAMTGSIAAAVYALKQPAVGGLSGLVARTDPAVLGVLPDWSRWSTVVAIFIVPLTVQWWATWYPGSEPGGGSYIAQRMLAARSERDALSGTLLFNVAHYAIRPWPWILVALASMLVFPHVADIQQALPHVDPALLGNDMAYPAMLTFLPAGLLGLMVAGLLAAYVSTISTHLNWGTSYLVHDFYRRFLRPGAGRTPLRASGPDRHGRAHGGGGAVHHRPGDGAAQLRPAALGRRGHRAAVPAALVLVARQRLERDRGDAQFLPHGRGTLRRRGGRARGRHRRLAAGHRRGHHRRLDRGYLHYARHRRRGSAAVLSAGASWRAGLGGRPAGVRRVEPARPGGSGLRRLGGRMRVRVWCPFRRGPRAVRGSRAGRCLCHRGDWRRRGDDASAAADMADVKAVVLARGLARRMRAAQGDAALLPGQARAADAGLKAMMPVGGADDSDAGPPRPFLDYVIGTLADAGFEDVGLVIGPEHSDIRTRYERELVPTRVRVRGLVQAEPRGTADAVLAVEDWVGPDAFVVLNADNLYPVDVLRDLRALGQPGLPVFERDELVRSSNIPADRIAAFALVRIDDHGRLTGIVEKPGADAVTAAGPHALVSMNCWRFDASIFGACRDVPRSPRGEFELPMAVGLALERGVRFQTIRAHGEVLDLSRRADVASVSARLAGRAPRL